MFPILRTVFAPAIVLLLAGCGVFLAGQDFDIRSFEAKVERGVTTQDQIRKWVGAPVSTGLNVDTSGDRFEEWTYYFASGRLPDISKAKVKTLQIKFDKQGIVRGYQWSMSDR